MSEWISVDDRLPEKGKKVDVWDSFNMCRIPDCYLSDEGFISSYRVWSGECSHWMPLPSPPVDNSI